MSNFPPDMIEATQRLCADSQRYTEVRRVLLDLEAEGHRAGWDAPANDATVFSVSYDRVTGRAQAYPSPALNIALRIGLEMGIGEPGAVLGQLADGFDQARVEVDAVGAGGVADPPGVEFYGYALRSEGWSTSADPDGEAHEAARRHELDRYPGRIEIRQVYLVGRDGLSWWALRHRGKAPQVLATLPENPAWAQAGRIPNALARMTNARARSHSPVPPFDLPEPSHTEER